MGEVAVTSRRMFAVSGRARSTLRRSALAGTVNRPALPALLTEEVYAQMTVLRQVVGDTLRGLRLRQRRTLREVSASARVSLGYLSEVERGQKEPSSELLAAIAAALEVELSELFQEVTAVLRREEKLVAGAMAVGHLAAIPGAGSARLTPAAKNEAGGTTGPHVREPKAVAA